jgi:hypothetical protein
MNVHRPYRTASQHAADTYAMRLLNLAEAHATACQCWACCADVDPIPASDPHEPNIERGWWTDTEETEL